jgi:probable phosphoglycerate mutase
MQQTRLSLIRHGETEWNIAGRLQGWEDSPLSALGLSQANRLADTLVGLKPSILMSSDAGRAVATATIIGGKLGLAPTIDVRLREINFGKFEGKVQGTMPPEEIAERDRILAMDPACTAAIPGGESPAQVSARVWSCIDEVSGQLAGTTILVVSHGAVLACVLRSVLGVPAFAPRRFVIGNTAFITLVRMGNGPWMVEFDDLDPLTPASRPA